MTTYNWQVTAMNCYPLSQGQSDVVFNVHWTCVGVDGEYSANTYSTCQVEFAGGAYTPYDQLTQEQVLGWIWANGVNQTATEAAVEQQIQNLINPPVVSPPLPWST